jgi:hypothetical protein
MSWLAGEAGWRYAVMPAESGSQNQLSILGEPQAVIATLMLDDDLDGAAQQAVARNPGRRAENRLGGLARPYP